MMTNPFQLVPDEISRETVQCLTTLLEQAVSGELLGVAYVAMYKGRQYIVNRAGECDRSRTFTRGMVDDLHESLRTDRSPGDDS